MSNDFAIICLNKDGLFLSFINSFNSILNAKDELGNIYNEYACLGYERKYTKNEMELVLFKTKKSFIFVNTFTVSFQIVAKKNIFKNFPIDSLSKITKRAAIMPIAEI
jgi:hypothetical protein